MQYEIRSAPSGLELDPAAPVEIELVGRVWILRKLVLGVEVLELLVEESNLPRDLLVGSVIPTGEEVMLTLTMVPRNMFAMCRSVSSSLKKYGALYRMSACSNATLYSVIKTPLASENDLTSILLFSFRTIWPLCHRPTDALIGSCGLEKSSP